MEKQRSGVNEKVGINTSIMSGFDKEIIAANAKTLEKELEWLIRLIRFRAYHHAEEDTKPQFDDVKALTLKDFEIALPPEDESPFGNILRHYMLNVPERGVLLLTLLPVFFPGVLSSLIGNDEYKGIHQRLMLVKSEEGILLPTVETVLFILAGNDLELRMKLSGLFRKDHILLSQELIQVESQSHFTELRGVVQPTEELVDFLQMGAPRKPDLSPNFPAKLLRTEMEWKDLVLEDHTARQLEDLEQWLRYSGELRKDKHLGKKLQPGYKILFHGPSGTGKTLAATLIGKKTGRDVYRVDLSMVVSKYIGETEKNLRRLFDKAEQRQWILFFDEADALFGKRTSVSSSNDRYANQEVSYLLQRLEYFDGMVILATNLKENIDHAFIRRLRGIVSFSLPRKESRLKLWKEALPEGVELDGIDLKELASEYNLSGANIVNIVEHCAIQMRAAQTNSWTFPMMRESIVRELAKESRTL